MLVEEVPPATRLPLVDAQREVHEHLGLRHLAVTSLGLSSVSVEASVEDAERRARGGSNDHPRVLVLQALPASSAVIGLEEVPRLARMPVDDQVETGARLDLRVVRLADLGVDTRWAE